MTPFVFVKIVVFNFLPVHFASSIILEDVNNCILAALVYSKQFLKVNR